MSKNSCQKSYFGKDYGRLLGIGLLLLNALIINKIYPYIIEFAPKELAVFVVSQLFLLSLILLNACQCDKQLKDSKLTSDKKPVQAEKKSRESKNENKEISEEKIKNEQELEENHEEIPQGPKVAKRFYPKIKKDD